MCSIFGVIHHSTVPASITRSILDAANAAQAHRGPDGSGTLVSGDGRLMLGGRTTATGRTFDNPVPGVRSGASFGFGHTRLSIRDPEGGHQPMMDPSGRFAISFNGEIYNADEITAELKSLGVHPRTHCDTEVILLGYIAWGKKVIDRLRGMFAFAIWDGRNDSFLLARDRFGIKPLLYALTPNALLFASELKALLRTGLVERRVRTVAIQRYLRHLYVPGTEGPLESVHFLAPGHLMEVHDGRVRTERYWELQFRTPDAGTLEDHTRRFMEELERSVREHLVSDVPIAAFLSGGLDSSAVTALMCRHAGAVSTYTIGFEDPEYDESPDAALVAQHLKTKHHCIPVSLSGLSTAIEKVLRHYDQPFADSSAVPTYLLSQATARDVKVALAGDGSDELLAGYRRARDYALLERMRQWPGPARSVAGGLAEVVAPFLGGRRRRAENFAQFFRELAVDRRADDMSAYIHLRRPFRGGWEERLFSPSMTEALRNAGSEDLDAHIREVSRRSGAPDPVSKLLHVELSTYLTGDILQKVDMATMAHGLEARVPFLDHKLVEFAANLPIWAKLNGKEQKVVLRRGMAPYLPIHTRARKKKGFHLPIPQWFRTDGRQMVQDLLCSPSFDRRGFFNKETVRTIITEHLAGIDHGSRLWTLLQLELWQREWVDAR